MTDDTFTLRSTTLGGLPIINAFLARLGADTLLEKAVVADPRSHVPPAQVLGALLRSLTESHLPLYALGEWMAQRDPGLLGLPDSAVLNDDRVGRSLESLFDADRARLQTALVMEAIRQYRIDCSEFHNDSTSITFSGVYAHADGASERGRPTPKITWGHNKDHRDDLKQLLWILTVSADGAVPVHCAVTDGNVGDTDTHQAAWDLLRQLAGRSDFLYVADSKLCTRENMRHIDTQGGRFITVMPKTRKEERQFRAWVETSHSMQWDLVRQGHGRDGRPEDYFMTEAPWPSAEGFRVAWVLSSGKARRDAESRRARIAMVSKRLDELCQRLGGAKARIRTRDGADNAVQAILSDTGTQQFFAITLDDVIEPHYQQARRGRPGTDTKYVRKDRHRITLTWHVRADEVTRDAASDGMFPLITNCRDLSLRDLLERYKYQPCLERRHEQLKSGLEVTPVWLKKITRIEAIMFLFFVALLVRALIEREIRNHMDDDHLTSLPLYPEDRDCPAPTAERILAIFATVQRHELISDGRAVQVFEPELTTIQRRVLHLLNLSPTIYRRDAT